MIIRADGSSRQEIASSAIANENSWTPFVRWWPDGRAVINTAWESPENYAWEKEHRTFRMTEGNWLTDCCLVDIRTGQMVNLTAVERVSNYNAGLAPWPGDPTRVTFAPLINEIQHPFVMDSDGRNKKDLSSGKDGFTYGCDVSPDGQRITYNKDYLVYIVEKDGSNPRRVQVGPAVELMRVSIDGKVQQLTHSQPGTEHYYPAVSSDGRLVAFGVRQTGAAALYVADADGRNARRITAPTPDHVQTYPKWGPLAR